ncbi:MAG: ImmA/IrrE family metallo-endopeptidase, partial [Candidatus Nealsonbacteria bacterium]|nr:ImmA/IrrE family metallo-endopeptidase [Candidatus Nealsonbacteria bacterium]
VIKTESDYDVALAAIEALIDRDPDRGTPEADELEVLSLLVEKYESKSFPSSLPDPIEAIKFRMEQQKLTQRDLIPFVGSRSKVSEVLSGKRSLTLSMIRSLHRNLGIPASALLQERDPSVLEESGIDWSRFPVREIVARGWVTTQVRNVREGAEEIVRDLYAKLGKSKPAVAMFRKTKHVRSARSMDDYALDAWSARVAIRAKEDPPPVPFESGTVNLDFMQEVARLSWSKSGPLLAQEYLRRHGIPLIIEPHLPRTYLDGAAILVEVERPIIGLTIRHDRIDNFWYCLMHELAHIACHLDAGVCFFDDLDVEDQGNAREEEADELAGEALIPNDVWQKSSAKSYRAPEAAEHLAKELRIHRAIVAGRMRHDSNNYRILNQLVGHRQVRRLFPEVKWSG